MGMLAVVGLLLIFIFAPWVLGFVLMPIIFFITYWAIDPPMWVWPILFFSLVTLGAVKARVGNFGLSLTSVQKQRDLEHQHHCGVELERGIKRLPDGRFSSVNKYGEIRAFGDEKNARRFRDQYT